MSHPGTLFNLPCTREESLARKYSEIAADRAGHGPPRLLVCWPAARMNKFQSLLYRCAPDCGFAVERISDLAELEEIFWPGGIVFNAHWFNPLRNGVDSAEELQANIDAAFQAFATFRTRTGARFVWSGHNLKPHRSAYPEAEITLRKRILQEFDAVHLLDGDHAGELQKAYDVEIGHWFNVGHPHYGGAYADHIERAEARERIGFDPGARILLFFGSVQRYKGISRLIEAFQAARRQGCHDLRLIIAGFPSDKDYVAEVSKEASRDPAIRYFPNKVPDDDIQLYFRTADAAVLPYSGDQLNSGAAMLALSFDCPVIAPNEPAFQRLSHYGIALYDNTDPAALGRALLDFDHRLIPTDFAAFRREHDSHAISRAFFDNLKALFE
ncbi:glycosyltransferase [Parasphingopyxis sp.]|uniref:glycosyltransferase n=1 Tax=Parasphingopyxis sp. TaxID=1920299 RepID=UPI00262EB756|nr:glycosyltransferase [Parasphingopyxis sp.]